MGTLPGQGKEFPQPADGTLPKMMNVKDSSNRQTTLEKRRLLPMDIKFRKNYVYTQ